MNAGNDGGMTEKVMIYVPSTVDVDQAIDNSVQVQEAATLLADCFGGATSIHGSGWWVSNEKGLVQESVMLVYSYADKAAILKHRGRIEQFCRDLCQRMRQECISLEISNSLRFITAAAAA